MNFIKNVIKEQLHKRGWGRVSNGFVEVSDGIYQNLYSEDSLENKRFYNIGAGSFSHNYWTNIDYATDYYAEQQRSGFINHNLMSLSDILVESNTAEIVYTSHTIEHISEKAVEKMFSEAFRMLKRGGACG